MSPAVRMARVTSLPFQTLNDETLVVDPRTREVHLLNPTASRIWDLLARPHTADALATALAEEFEAPLEAIRADVQGLLGELSAKGLVGEAIEAREPADAAGEPDSTGAA
jgi:PqqD family protein of HPr-rel-A system